MHNLQIERLQSVAAGVDVTDDASLGQLLKSLGDQLIDLLIITAGAQETDKLENVTKDSIRRQIEANAIGPLFTIKGLQDRLRKGSKVLLGVFVQMPLVKKHRRAMSGPSDCKASILIVLSYQSQVLQWKSRGNSIPAMCSFDVTPGLNKPKGLH